MRPKAIGIISRLKAATGNEPTRKVTPFGLRIEMAVPAEMSDTARAMLLSALADATAYGHTRGQDGERVWATIEDWQP